MTPAAAAERELAAIEALLGAETVDTGLFTPAFLAAVPPAQLQAVLTELQGKIGPVTGIEALDDANYRVETATHTVPVQIVLDADGKISGLLFKSAVARSLDFDTLREQFEALAPEFHLLVTRNGAPLYAANPERPLAVGSAFKLGVLQALSAQIAAGTHAWDEVVRLDERDKSLPSGTLQTWPTGAPLTLHTLVAMMLSISDNTATDALIRIVGREAVEVALGIAPVLTTRELFTLKADPALAGRYLAGDLATRRTVLAEAATRPLPAPGRVGTHYHPEMEWTISAETLCRLIESVADLDVMAIDPGVAQPADWPRIAFKGGSEAGVLNLTTALTAADGTRYCVAATWNAPQPVDESAAISVYAGLLELLKRG